MKICTKCKLEREENEFFSDKRHSDGLYSSCKSCCRDFAFKHRRTEKGVMYMKKYNSSVERKICLREYNNCDKRREYLEKRRMSIRYKEYNREYKQTEKYKAYEKEHMLEHLLRHRLRMALKGNFKAGSAVRDLGCTIQELKVHLEKLFKPGMTWENYGEWHIDHKYPLSKADLTDREQLLKVCHYTNLQPLWKLDNLKKWNKI